MIMLMRLMFTLSGFFSSSSWTPWKLPLSKRNIIHDNGDISDADLADSSKYDNGDISNDDNDDSSYDDSSYDDDHDDPVDVDQALCEQGCASPDTLVQTLLQQRRL